MKLNASINIGITIATLSICSLVGTTVMAETGAIWYNCRIRKAWTPEQQAWCDRVNRLQNATYIVPNSLDANAKFIQVTLKDGKYQRPDGKFEVLLVNQQNWIAFGDVNGDGKQDAAVILGVAFDRNPLAVGTYLTTVLDVDGQARVIAPIRLGGRIMLNGPISITNNSIIVPFLTQDEVINRVFVIQETLKERQ